MVLEKLSFLQLNMMIYQHAMNLQAAEPTLAPQNALSRARALATMALDEAGAREELSRLSQKLKVQDVLSRLETEPGGATLALGEQHR